MFTTMIARALCLLGLFCVSHGASNPPHNDIWAEHEAEFETPAPARALTGSGSGYGPAPTPAPPGSGSGSGGYGPAPTPAPNNDAAYSTQTQVFTSSTTCTGASTSTAVNFAGTCYVAQNPQQMGLPAGAIAYKELGNCTVPVRQGFSDSGCNTAVDDPQPPPPNFYGACNNTYGPPGTSNLPVFTCLVPHTKITTANTMTGFTKATFVGKYQTAFIAASAFELGVAASKVTLTNFADKARRLSTGRRLAASVTFDTVVTLTAAELEATPTLLATIETKAKAVAANSAALVTAFEAQQVAQGVPLIKPTITSKPPTTSGGAPKKDGSSSKAWVAAPVVVILGAVGYMKFAGKGCFAPPTTKDGNVAGAATEAEGSAVAHQNAL